MIRQFIVVFWFEDMSDHGSAAEPGNCIISRRSKLLGHLDNVYLRQFVLLFGVVPILMIPVHELGKFVEPAWQFPMAM